MSDYPMLISNKLHSFRNFIAAKIRSSCLSFVYGLQFFIYILQIRAILAFLTSYCMEDASNESGSNAPTFFSS